MLTENSFSDSAPYNRRLSLAREYIEDRTQYQTEMIWGAFADMYRSKSKTIMYTKYMYTYPLQSSVSEERNCVPKCESTDFNIRPYVPDARLLAQFCRPAAPHKDKSLNQ